MTRMWMGMGLMMTKYFEEAERIMGDRDQARLITCVKCQAQVERLSFSQKYCERCRPQNCKKAMARYAKHHKKTSKVLGEQFECACCHEVTPRKSYNQGAESPKFHPIRNGLLQNDWGAAGLQYFKTRNEVIQ